MEQALGPHDMDSLAADITAGLNGAGKHAAMGTYSCIRVSGGLGGGAGGLSNKAFYITCAQGNFRLPNDDLTRSEYGVQGLTWSTNSLFSFQCGGEVLPSHKSGFVDLRRCHNILLHCPVDLTTASGRGEAATSLPKFRLMLLTVSQFI